jgi:RNA polymerase sigma factor (sigma-70 family)
MSGELNNAELVPHLFRTEYAKITAVLTRLFGIEHLQVAEDIASDTFVAALETWSYNGIPENPTAWLYAVAKNKTRNLLKHDEIFASKVSSQVTASFTDCVEPNVDLSDDNIMDSQLSMLFAVCHPSISPESQVCFALRILCGFGIQEIADAFLTNKETINKRLHRAKEKLRIENINIELPPPSELEDRLEAVLTAIYLLYNEGYYSESKPEILREDYCREAMGLGRLLIENPETDRPKVNALYSLMCFHSSRFGARKSDSGEFISYYDQDESLWDQELITQGAYFLRRASIGDKLSKYHLEAAIAYWHTVKADTSEKWKNILSLYDQLLQLGPSPIAALNRLYALAKTGDREAAITEAQHLNLSSNHFYFALLGELYKEIDTTKSIESLRKALSLAKSTTDKNTIKSRLDALTGVK